MGSRGFGGIFCLPYVIHRIMRQPDGFEVTMRD